MKDQLGDRMKDFYESRYKIKIPRRTFTIIRIDGKSFHTYTKGLIRPFDEKLMSDMDETACFICKNIQGAKFAFVQSDEISVLLTDFDNLQTDAFFDGNLQKITSISASLATAKFNELRPGKLAMFDSRVFIIPFIDEVQNYFIWRQQDATRNSISSLAQSLYSHKELNNKKTSELQDMCFEKGYNWNNLEAGKKRGRGIIKEKYLKGDTERTRWISTEVPILSSEQNYIKNIIDKF